MHQTILAGATNCPDWAAPDPRCDFYIPTIGPLPAPCAKASQSISICHHRILNNIVSDPRTCFMAKRLLGHRTHSPCHTPHLPEAASLRGQWDRGTANRAFQGMGQSLVSLGTGRRAWLCCHLRQGTSRLRTLKTNSHNLVPCPQQVEYPDLGIKARRP